MANQNAKSCLIRMGLGIWVVSGSLIANISSKNRISKWRIQYGEKKCKKLIDSNGPRYLGFFRVADYEYELKILKFKMDSIWRTKLQKFN